MNLLEALRYLTALEQHRHFGRAAQACGITQPALSNAIRALEQELGVPVVRRARQYEGLTNEGEVVIAHAHRLLREAESLRQELHSRVDAPRGALQIGAVPTALPVAGRFAAQLRARHAGIEPVLRSLSSPEIEIGLENLSLDMALGYTGREQVKARALQIWPQYEEAYFLVQRDVAGQAGADAAPMTWRASAALPLVMLTPDMHNRAIVQEAMRSAGAEPSPAVETNSVLALVAALEDGSLAAVLPGALLDVAGGLTPLRVHALVDPVVRTPIGFMTAAAARTTPALRAALELAQDAAWLRQLGRR
ncbi:MAG TPA: LysR substrate-binding domain-containing protein [Burkholderiaceae bacterium]